MAQHPVSVTFRPNENSPHPAVFRFVLADLAGQSMTPANADYVCPHSEQDVWAYARREIEFQVEPGVYAWLASAGPAWSLASGRMNIGTEPLVEEFEMRRLMDPHALGLAAGDGHLHTWRGHREDDFESSMAAEGIDFAGIQYWGLYTGHEHVEEPQGTGCFCIGDRWGTTDEEVEMHSPWGMWEDTTVVGLKDRLPDSRVGFGYRMNAVFYRAARERFASMIVYQSPTWAQFPIDSVLGLVDSVNLCDNVFSMKTPVQGPWSYTQLTDDDPHQNEEFGLATWVFDNYYRVINAGIRLAVSGGSAYPHGGGGGPLGLSRFYVETGGATDVTDYLLNWEAGRTFATNGPILVAELDGRRPERYDSISVGDRSCLSLRALCSRPLACLQWIGDGRVIAEKSCDRTTFPCEVDWETKVDLRPYQWVAARAFGESERTLFPEAGRASSPFLTAHTSPFYLESYAQPSANRSAAASELLSHIDWMREVVDGRIAAPFAGDVFVKNPLGDRERAEIHGILAEAAKAYEGKL